MERPHVKRVKGSTAPPPIDQAGHLLQSQIERLESQFSKLREQVRQTQQLASLGTAAAMMAHEFNNVMTPVVGYARFAVDSDDPELMKKALNMTLKQASIVSAMSERILGLAASEAPSCEPVPLKALVEDAAACMCRDPAKDGITLQVDIAGDLKVLADQKQLRQVFFNLLLNARQAIEHRHGRIVVEARAGEDDRVEVRVRDNGSGIDAADVESIFEPFFTTKSGKGGSRRGCGLGLALCRDIITEQGGNISVESERGEGTTFTIILSAAD